MTDGIPAALPALALAAKLQRKALSVPGLQLPTFEAERRWVAAALAQLSTRRAAPEDPSAGRGPGSVPAVAGDEEVRRVGALLWGLADLGRQLGVDPEDSLRAAALRSGPASKRPSGSEGRRAAGAGHVGLPRSPR